MNPDLSFSPSDRVQALAALHKVFYPDRPVQSEADLASWEVVYRELTAIPQPTAQQREKAIHRIFSGLIHSLYNQLRPTDQKYAERCLRILQNQLEHHQPVDSFARNVLNISRSQYYRDLERCLDLLAELLIAEEIAAHLYPFRMLPPASYTRLFGADSLIASLLAAFSDPAAPSVAVIDGLGGIGKTSVGREAAQQALKLGIFQALFWKSAQRAIFTWEDIAESSQSTLTHDALLDSLAEDLGRPDWASLPTSEKIRRLCTRLNETSTLIVVDNLETASDIHSLVDTLADITCSRSIRILITSRRRLEHRSPMTCFHLQPLSTTDGMALIRHFAAERGQIELANAPVEQIRRIHEAVGGHPLAIKLVVSQLEALSVEQALHGINGSGRMEHFYNFIYRNSWEMLSAPARQTLLALAHTPPAGGRWDEVLAFCGLPEDSLAPALLELVRFSLVCATGDAEKCYILHPLTRRFILNELAKVEIPFSGREFHYLE